MLVAGQWDPTKVAPLAKNNLWIVVSQEDAKAYPGMNAITNTLEKEGGAKISRAIWDVRANESEFTYDVT
jgi:predicted peptidase